MPHSREASVSTGSNSSGESSSYNDTTATDSYTTRTNNDTVETSKASTATPRSAGGLDLRTNDNSFHVIAQVIVDKYKEQLSSPQVSSITISRVDRLQMDRMVPNSMKANFIDAVQYRLKGLPENSDKPIHVLTIHCRTLGLDLVGDQNLLNSPVGTVISINANGGPTPSVKKVIDKMKDEVAQMQELLESSPESLARQQLLAELREASTLMAESVTPEAAQFWRKHVVELQARLRAIHEKIPSVRSVTSDAEEIMRSNERLLASLNENTGYVPPGEDEFRSTLSPRGVPTATRQQHNNIHPDFAPMVDVVAPANLPAGYCFEAEVNNERFLATVPPGGVRKGETFSCYMKDLDNGHADIPVGTWRDGLFACFKHGVCHPMLCNAFFCPLLALSQIMSRVEVDFMGRPANDIPKTGRFSTRGMISTIITFWLFLNLVVLGGMKMKAAGGLGTSFADKTAVIMINLAMLCYLIVATMATRRTIRERYLIGEEIRNQRLRGMEDGLYAAAFLPCTIAQMGRHTASYEDQDAACCTNNGLDSHHNV